MIKQREEREEIKKEIHRGIERGERQATIHASLSTTFAYRVQGHQGRFQPFPVVEHVDVPPKQKLACSAAAAPSAAAALLSQDVLGVLVHHVLAGVALIFYSTSNVIRTRC